MSAVLLTWKTWPHEALKRLIDDYQRDGYVETTWRVRPRQAKEGDYAFLLKQGARSPRGIFGFGVLLDAPSRRADNDDPIPRWRAPVRFQRLTDPRTGFLIPLADLGILRSSLINSQASGVSLLPDEERHLLDRLAARDGRLPGQPSR